MSSSNRVGGGLHPPSSHSTVRTVVGTINASVVIKVLFVIIALVVTLLGGTSIMGGFGSILCAVAGAFILGIVSSSVNMLVLVLIVTLARAEE